MFRATGTARPFTMAGVKITSFVDAIAQVAEEERRLDREALLGVVEEEIDKLNEIIEDLRARVERLEAARPTFSG
jgi:ubiquinone biosynthesis protein UbiJ